MQRSTRRLTYRLIGAETPKNPKSVVDDPQVPKWIQWMHLGACIVHAFHTFFMFYLPKNKVTGRIFMEYIVWEDKRGTGTGGLPFEIYPSTEQAGYPLELKWFVGSFTLLSAIFHLVYWITSIELSGLSFLKGTVFDYPKQFNNRAVVGRFVEYAMSASLMLCLLAYFAGIRTVFHLILIGTLSVATQSCGYFIERNMGKDQDEEEGSSVFRYNNNLRLFGVGSIFLLVVFADIAITLLISAGNVTGDNRMPDFVYVIVFGEFFLYCSFGFIQLWRLFKDSAYDKTIRNITKSGQELKSVVHKEQENNEELVAAIKEKERVFQKAEKAYIAMSIVAKSTLAWIVYASVLMVDKYCSSTDGACT